MTSEEVLSRAARGLFDKIANTLINNNDPLATSGRQNITLDNANVLAQIASIFAPLLVTLLFLSQLTY